MTALTIICFSLLPALEFSWDVIRTSIRTMPTSVLFLTWITNYQSADAGQARKLLLNAGLLQKCRGVVVVVVLSFPLFFSPVKVLFVFCFWGLLKIVWELDCCGRLALTFFCCQLLFTILRKSNKQKTTLPKQTPKPKQNTQTDNFLMVTSEKQDAFGNTKFYLKFQVSTV